MNHVNHVVCVFCGGPFPVARNRESRAIQNEMQLLARGANQWK